MDGPVKRDSALALVPTMALIDELLARFDSALFAGLRDEGQRGSEDGSVFEVKRYRGDAHRVLGLLSRTTYYVNVNFEEACQPSEDL